MRKSIKETEMKHIVFVIGYYFPEAGSTSLCAIKVMKDLQKNNDIELSCICGTNMEDINEYRENVDLYRIHHVSFTDALEKHNTRWEILWAKSKKTINDIANFRHYPDMDMGYSRKIAAQLERIEKKKHIDAIVAVYMPKQSISGVLLFKKAHPKTKCLAYFLDTLRSNKPKLMPSNVHKLMLNKYERKVFSAFDQIILMEYGKEYYSSSLCDLYKKKINYLGLPSLEIMELRKKESHGKKCIYIGSTYSDIRNPHYAMKVFEAAHEKDSTIQFSIYGSSNMKKDLIEWQSRYPDSFYYHDYINYENIRTVYEDADYVVNIGNTLKNVVPGKTFEILGTLKPIIHFTDGLNDSSLKFIKQYPNVCIITYTMTIETAVDILMQYLNRPYILSDRHVIENSFQYATPNAVSNLICKLSM